LAPVHHPPHSRPFSLSLSLSLRGAASSSSNNKKGPATTGTEARSELPAAAAAGLYPAGSLHPLAPLLPSPTTPHHTTPDVAILFYLKWTRRGEKKKSSSSSGSTIVVGSLVAVLSTVYK